MTFTEGATSLMSVREASAERRMEDLVTNLSDQMDEILQLSEVANRDAAGAIRELQGSLKRQLEDLRVRIDRMPVETATPKPAEISENRQPPAEE